MGSVITIDNFTTQMSSFDVNTTGKQLYGLVDMGSNGIRFSISNLSPPHSRLLRCVYRERAGISLYDALHESTLDAKPLYFSEQTITKVAAKLRRFKSICDGYGVAIENINVFATEAMRTAKNQDTMLQAIKEASGLNVDILSPNMESLFGAMGARSGYVHVDGLFMDLGGGSIQITYVNSKLGDDYDTRAAEAAMSMPFGAAKLTAALSSESTAEAAKTELRISMKRSFERLKQSFPQLREQSESHDGIAIYFCGGGFRGYGMMLMHTDPIQPYPIHAIRGYVVPGHRFIKWREMLHANNYEAGKIYGISKRRREQFPAIVTVVQSLVETIPKIKEATFCSGGNREGVLFMKLPASVRESHPLPHFPTTATEQDPRILGSVVSLVTSALPSDYPLIFGPELLNYVARNIWVDQGDDGNSSRVLHNCISGLLAGLPGLTHELRAIIALILVARWGGDLGPIDKKVLDNLQSLIGHKLAWWCQYIGAIAGFIASISPVIPANENLLQNLVAFKARTSAGLGKKGHKVGIRLLIELPKQISKDVHIGGLEVPFDNVGKGLPLAWKVEAELVEVET